MALKRKTLVSQKAGAFARNTRKTATKAAAAAEKLNQKKDSKDAAKEEEEAEEEQDEVETTMKRPAAAKNQKDVEEQEDNEDCDVEEEEEEEEAVSKKPAAASSTCDDVEIANAQIVAVENKEPTEAEINRERTKELKGMSAADLKEMATNFGLETGTKEMMIGRVLKHEAKLRKEALAQKAKIRAVVMEKKQELEDLSIPELTKLCNDAGFKGLRSKPEKVQKLIIHWQENQGVEKAFVALAIQERKDQLNAMDDEQLQKICCKYGVDPHIKEVVADRISRKEHELGRYVRPGIREVAEAAADHSKLDMIEALLASEAQRKKESELRSKREQTMQNRSKEYRAMSLDELKKLIAKKKLESGEKKDEMVTVLLMASVQEDLAAARKGDLQAKPKQALIDLLTLNGLDCTGSTDKMIKRFLEHEEKVNEEMKTFEGHVDAAAKERKGELEKKNNAQLKDLCEEQGLALGGGKEERIDRLLCEEKKSRSFDEIVSKNMRVQKWAALMSMGMPQLLAISSELEVDPLLKGAMVERIMAHEREHASAEQPKTKKARASK